MKRRDDLLVSVHKYVRACRRRRTAPHVSELAMRLGMTRHRLHAEFTAAVGFPPARYLQNLQLEFARGLLRDGYAVAAVSDCLGLTESAFRRAYGKYFGHPPKADLRPRSRRRVRQIAR